MIQTLGADWTCKQFHSLRFMKNMASKILQRTFWVMPLLCTLKILISMSQLWALSCKCNFTLTLKVDMVSPHFCTLFMVSEDFLKLSQDSVLSMVVLICSIPILMKSLSMRKERSLESELEKTSPLLQSSFVIHPTQPRIDLCQQEKSSELSA